MNKRKIEKKFDRAIAIFILGSILLFVIGTISGRLINSAYTKLCFPGYRVIDTEGRLVQNNTAFYIDKFNSNGVVYRDGADPQWEFKKGFADANGNEVYEAASEAVSKYYICEDDLPYIDDEIFAFNDKPYDHDSQTNVVIIILETGEENIVENARISWDSERREGLIPLIALDKWEIGYVDKYGQWVIEPKFLEAENFQEGVAAVCEKDKTPGYINTKGEYVLAPDVNTLRSFNEGYAAVSDESDLYGYIDKTGNIVIEPAYEYAGDFSEGLALVSDATTGKYGYIDKNGDVAIDFKFDEAYPFSDGLARIKDDTTDKYGFIDKSGQIVIPCIYVNAKDFSDGLAKAEKVQLECGYIDKQGKWLFEPNVERRYDFKNGYAIIYLDLGVTINYDLSDGCKWKKDYMSYAKTIKTLYFFYEHRYVILAVIFASYMIYFIAVMIVCIFVELKHPDSEADEG